MTQDAMERFEELVRRGQELLERYEAHGDEAARDEAIACYRKADEELQLPDELHVALAWSLLTPLLTRGEARGDADDLMAVLRYGARCLEAIDEDPSRAAVLCHIGIAHLLLAEHRPERKGEELQQAVESLRQALAGAGDDDLMRGMAASRLAVAFACWVLHDLAVSDKAARLKVADRMDEAVGMLTEAERDMRPDDGFRVMVRHCKACTQAIKFLLHGGSDDEYEAAKAACQEVLEIAEEGTDPANTAHIFLAFLLFFESLPGELRQRFIRSDWNSIADLMQERPEHLIAKLEHSPGEIGRAMLDHLNQVTGTAMVDPKRELLSSVREMATMLTGPEAVALELSGGSFLSVQGADLIESLERALTELPDGHETRAVLLSAMGLKVIIKSYPAQRLERLRELLLEKIERPCADAADAAAERFLLRAVDGLRVLHDPDAGTLNSVITQIMQAADTLPPGHLVRLHMLWALSTLLQGYHNRRGGIEYLEAAQRYADMAREETRGAGEDAEKLQSVMDALCVDLSLGRFSKEIDTGQIDTIIERQEQVLSQGSFGTEQQRDRIREHLAELQEHRALYSNFNNPFAAGGGHSETESLTGVPQILSGLRLRNLALFDAGMAAMEKKYKDVDMSGHWMDWRMIQGSFRYMRYRITGDRTDLDVAIHDLEQLRRDLEENPYGAHSRATLLLTLAHAYHERGDRNLGDQDKAIEIATAELHERAVDVLLQSNVGHAFESARDAAGEATLFARWCVAAERLEKAVEMLERGRAMVLHAATADTGIPSLLRRAGHFELAEEWENTRAGTDAMPGGAGSPVGSRETPLLGDLRYRVVHALAGSEAEQRLFTPPGVRQIGEALRACGAAALVYLVPQDESGSGFAVIVEPDGRVRKLPLFWLSTTPGSPVADFAAALRDRQQAEPDTPEWERAHRRWRSALAELCEWAWPAAMERIFTAIGADPAQRPRLVLVPAGALSLVPWHAARRKVADGRWRYACQDAVLSYAASTRQFLEAHSRPPRDLRSEAVLVRTPGGLLWASKEVRDLHARHYPDGLLLGDRRDRPATPDDVLAHLPRRGSLGASLLHLGCHAKAAERPVDSYLQLARGRRLAMADILEQARDRPRDGAGGLVVLAACASDLTGRDHDEALTLATAFLAAGATGVVGTRWPVDDLPTALFMTMFHHCLNAGYPDPAAALRAAQLWMLDPRRSLPVATDMAEEMDRVDLTAVEHWAAFTYQGR